MGKLRVALDHRSMYRSMPCIPHVFVCERITGQEVMRRRGDDEKSSFRERNDVGLGGART